MSTDSSNISLYGLHDSKPELYQKGNEHNIALRWDKKAFFWDDQLKEKSCHLNQDNAYDEFIRVAKSFICKYSDSTRELTLLDVGSGTGIVAEELGVYFSKVVGIDISKEMLKIAKRKSIPNSNFYKRSVFELNFWIDRFDFVVSRGVLLSHYGKQHATDIISSLCGVLQPEGMIIIDFLNKDVEGNYEHLPTNKEYYSASEMIHIANNAGCKDIEIIGQTNQRTLIASMKASSS